MMGKTQMCFALPESDVFVFYFCLREADSSGYPKGLSHITNALTDPCTEGFYSAFTLAALEALDKFKTKYEGVDSVFKAWFLEHQKHDFWTGIIGLYNHIFSELHIPCIFFLDSNLKSKLSSCVILPNAHKTKRLNARSCSLSVMMKEIENKLGQGILQN